MVSKMVTDLIEFNLKYDLPISNWPSDSHNELILSKVKHLFEECKEIDFAMTSVLEGHVDSLVDVADGIADLIYVAIGLAIICGLDIDSVFQAVHEANMKKIRKPSERSKYDVVKPEGWEAPNLKPIVYPHGFSNGYTGGIIVVDGADRTGKSTFISHLQDEFAKKENVVVFNRKCTYPHYPSLRTYYLNLLNFALNAASKGHYVIFDRYWMSDIVYSRVFRNNHGEMAINHFARGIEILMMQVPTTYIFTYCNPSRLEERMRKNINKELYKDIDRMKVVNSIYCNTALQLMSFFEGKRKKNTVNLKLIDTTFDDYLKKVARGIVSEMYSNQMAAEHYNELICDRLVSVTNDTIGELK